MTRRIISIIFILITALQLKAETVTITISEKLAVAIEDSNGLFINGQDISIKSMKVVE